MAKTEQALFDAEKNRDLQNNGKRTHQQSQRETERETEQDNAGHAGLVVGSYRQEPPADGTRPKST